MNDNDNDEYKDFKKYPSAYDQRLIGDHVARLLSRGIKALKLNRRQQQPTEGAEPAHHHRYWTQYLLSAGAIIMILALLESLLKLK